MGHAARAAKALELAAIEGCQALVFAVDVDRTAGRRASAVERRRKLAQLHEEIEDGFAHTRELDAATSTVAYVKATPCRMIEAWALADADAVSAVAGVDAAELPARPEECWGDERQPASNHPKRLLQRALGRPRATAEDFADIAGHAEVAALARGCPDSFGRFAGAVRECVARCRARRT